MRQRVAFLRTLLPGRPVLLLDEPFGALDSITRADRCRNGSPARSAAEPRTVLLVTHDVEEAMLLADRVACSPPAPAAWWPSSRCDLPRPRRRSHGDPESRRACAREALEALGA